MKGKTRLLRHWQCYVQTFIITENTHGTMVRMEDMTTLTLRFITATYGPTKATMITIRVKLYG
jgi:hypothetical protein